MATRMERQPRVLSATTIIGDRVRNSAGEDLGTIEELVIDIENGRVAYAVLSFGGFPGLGDKLFAIPWQALRMVTDEHRFVLAVDLSVLEHAPGFDKRNWPDMSDPMFHHTIHRHYGYTYSPSPSPRR
jgi:sporulation protein YlmC with PRC-barrel domain